VCLAQHPDTTRLGTWAVHVLSQTCQGFGCAAMQLQLAHEGQGLTANAPEFLSIHLLQ
jgi:hypothetical protein